VPSREREHGSLYGLNMMELPMFDSSGGSLESFIRLDRASPENLDVAPSFACSLVVVTWAEEVLLGFNVSRQQWELPGRGTG
jgi:hypothetical protein